MKRSRRWRPSPALVIACLALFVALGGTVLAATKINGRTIRVKSLPGNRLAVGSLPGNRLQKGTIPGNRIAPHSLRGDRIKVGTLGQVPSATHADSADTARRAQTATAADHAADATTINGHAVGCAEGRREFAGACWDMNPSTTPLAAFEAAAACGAEGGELPDLIALLTFKREPGIQISPGGEWTNDITYVTTTNYDVLAIKPSGELDVGSPSQPHQFRCVTPFLG
jgi:hypothetical protein